MPIRPSKANAPLLIDPNTELALSPSLQHLKMIPRRILQILKRGCIIEHSELSSGKRLNPARKLSRKLAIPDLFRLVRGKTQNHYLILTETETTVKRKQKDFFLNAVGALQQSVLTECNSIDGNLSRWLQDLRKRQLQTNPEIERYD